MKQKIVKVGKCFLWFKHRITLMGEDNQARCTRCGKSKVECIAGGKRWIKY